MITTIWGARRIVRILRQPSRQGSEPVLSMGRHNWHPRIARADIAGFDSELHLGPGDGETSTASATQIGRRNDLELYLLDAGPDLSWPYGLRCIGRKI